MNKNRILIVTFATFVSFYPLSAQEMKCGAGKCGASMKSSKTDTKLLKDQFEKDGYKIVLESKKPIAVGNNEIFVTLLKNGKKVTNAKVKIKFFMPEMPGMPYMEYKEKLKLSGDSYKGNVNFSMNGTWQYQLKFKDKDEKITTLRGSVNL